MSKSDGEADHLVREADYFYDRDYWDVTCNDLYELSEISDLGSDFQGRIVTVGRLKALPNAYAINIPVEFDDDEPIEWEVKLFETAEAAQAAFKKAAGDDQ